jgi:hypothetical protein
MGTSDNGVHTDRNGIFNAIRPAYEREWIDHAQLIQADYERCHPEDTFTDLLHRARFTKEDKGLLRHWMTVAARRAKATRSQQTAADSCRTAA